jgi:hypothetical protein
LRLGGAPLSLAAPELIASELDRVVLALTGTLSVCDVVPTFAPCDDNDLCTQGDVCTEDLFCEPVTETRSGCIASQCLECNPATGLCEGVVAAPLSCFSGCSNVDNGTVGSCNVQTGQCEPFFPDPAVCALPPSIAECNLQVCNTGYIGGLIPVPVGQLVPESAVLPFLTSSCSFTPRADGFICQTGQGAADACILTEECQAGQCVPTEVVDCTGIFDANPCVNSPAATCDVFTGNCDIPGFPTGTPCDTQNSCFVNEVCINDGFNTPTCIGTLAPGADCQVQASANPCIVSSFCDGSDPAGPRCIDQPAPNGFACMLDNPGLCDDMGVCQSGVCVPVPTECPPATGACRLPFCNPSTGLCGEQFAPDFSTCDDGLGCTVNDVCFGGSCAGTQRDCSPPECQVFVECSEPSGDCVFTPAPDGTACTDGTCSGGACILQCDPACQNGGVCLNVDPVECRCPFAFEGQFCQLESTNVMDEFDVLITDTIADLIGVFFQFFIYFAIISIIVAFCCYYLPGTPTIDAIIPVNKEL